MDELKYKKQIYKKAARSKLRRREDSDASPEVREHWKSIANGNVPFGYKVKGE